MMNDFSWTSFSGFALTSGIAWIISVILLIAGYKHQIIRQFAIVLVFVGLISILLFTIVLWINLDRPVLRTLAETRLWYTIFIVITGIFLYFRWRFRIVFLYCIGMGLLFTCLNYFNPDTFNKSLMPALQSVWFIPHVIVYMIAYALLGTSSLTGFYGLWLKYRNRDIHNIILLADNLIYVGFSFLTLGLLFGALWAKQAWGHYWTWDPKETWAFITWMVYLIYIHLRHKNKNDGIWSLRILVIAFVILLICWFGVNYLPTASQSVHVYQYQG